MGFANKSCKVISRFLKPSSRTFLVSLLAPLTSSDARKPCRYSRAVQQSAQHWSNVVVLFSTLEHVPWHRVLGLLPRIYCWYGWEQRDQAPSALTLVPVAVRRQVRRTVPLHVGPWYVLYSLAWDLREAHNVPMGVLRCFQDFAWLLLDTTNKIQQGHSLVQNVPGIYDWHFTSKMK